MSDRADGDADGIRVVSPVKRFLIVDLDDTLVDTRAVAGLRQQRRWREAVGGVNRTVIFPGVDSLVAGLGQHKVPWAVVTTSVSFYADGVLAHHGLRPGVRVAYHDAKPKPAPMAIGSRNRP